MSCRRIKCERRGATLTEVMMALLVVSAALTALAQFVSLAGQQRRAGEARRLALLELANQAERVAAMPWEATTADKLTGWTAAAEFSAAAPSSVCRVKVTEEAGPPASRRIELGVSWTPSGGRPVEPVTLTLWKFAPGGPP